MKVYASQKYVDDAIAESKEYVDEKIAINKHTGKSIEKVLLYYGYPIAINGVWNVEQAVNIYRTYDVVVFGDSYQNPEHDVYADTVAIIQRLAEVAPNVRVVGYVPIGLDENLEDSNLSMDELKLRVDQWNNIGVHGIFLDEFGYDYFVTRERQNEIVNYCHDLGKFVFANSWSFEYCFNPNPMEISWMPDFYPNPEGLAPVLNEDDYYLCENLFYTTDELDDGSIDVECASVWRIDETLRYYTEPKIDGKSYYEVYGTKVCSLDAVPSTYNNTQQNIMKSISIIGAAILNINSVAFGNEDWGASGDFDQWDLPNLDLSRDGLNAVTVDQRSYTKEDGSESSFPYKWTANMNGHNYSITFDIPNPDHSTWVDGMRYASMDDTVVENAWTNVFTFQSDVDDIRQSIDVINTRLDNHEDKIDSSVMIDKSFGNGPDTIAEGNHTHGDLQLHMQSIEEVINADCYDMSDSVDFFTDITPSHTVWYATSSSSVTDVDIIGGRYVCTTSTADQGLKTDTLDDLMEVVKGKTIVAVANISSDNYTLYIKMYDGAAWSFGRIKSTDKIVTVNVPENITKFRLGLEYGGDGSAPDTCEMTNFALYLVNDVAITSTANIPNRNYTIWSWNDEEITNPEAFASFCNAYKINRVYQHISTSTLDLATIRNFVGTLQKNRVSVNWLTGDPSWALTDHHYHIIDQIQKVVSYNMSIQNDYEKIGTIQFDVEPYTLDEWETDQASVVKQFQDAIVLMHNESIAKQLSLNVCVASWFDGVTYDNEYGQGNLFDFVSKHSSSTVIMAYNTSAYVSIAEDEIRMGALNGKNVAVGLETHVVDDSVTEDTTFANKPIEDLYRAFETLFLVYKMYGVYKGYEFVIHDYAYFKAYAESFNLTVESNDILSKLTTTDKTDIISAINEINESMVTKDELGNGTMTEFVLKSSTPDSAKLFKITVDDSGTITATEITE
jgi:hypothetical protein